MKPKLLVVELWGIGDLALAAPFLRGAQQTYDVTLLARPVASQLLNRLFGDIELIAIAAPWTKFKGKYRFYDWPWGHLNKVISQLRSRDFDAAVSARVDPRDHLLMWMSGAKRRLGFPRARSLRLLTDPITSTRTYLHRFTAWRTLAHELGVTIPVLRSRPNEPDSRIIVIHTGAARQTRLWPLERYAWVVDQLRRRDYEVQVLCDFDQKQWWLDQGEADVLAPVDVGELSERLSCARLFIGNDSGPGHIAALLGMPTFTVFGPQLPELFAPIHPMAEWVAGKSCDFKPCFDSCRFNSPRCLLDVSVEDVWPAVLNFVDKHIAVRQAAAAYQSC